jgi:hypothetical protein
MLTPIGFIKGNERIAFTIATWPGESLGLMP